MSMNPSQGVYAPLPQSLSDSESEKELNEPTRITFSSGKLQNGHDTRTHNGYSIPNHVVNMKPKRGFTSMSRARKCAFIFSIALCLLVIVVFLWVLPCTNHGTCPMRITGWKNEHEGVEFKGEVNVVRGPYGNAISLAFLTKKNINSQENQSGAIALKSSNGAVIWFIPQVRTPMKLNCYLIDANADGVTDCLLLGEIGLEAVDPLTGEIVWHVHTLKTLVSSVDFPVPLPDLNHDGIIEMITVTNENSFHNKLIIICGRTGQLLREFIITQCIEITSFKFLDDLLIYKCNNNSISHYYKMTLNDVQSKLNNSSYIIKPMKIEYHPKLDEEYILNGRRLIISNSGVCPNCQANITLIEDSTNKRLYEWTYVNMYVMKPVSFAFKPSENNKKSLRGHLNGFILKLWQWPGYTNKRSVLYTNSTIKKNNISEKVVLITFNDTNVHVINVSLVQITQLCYPNAECQPSLLDRNNSLLISDLDFDGSQELISYSTTYKCNDEDQENCQLVSNIEVIRLEAELPKLYAK